MKRHKPPDLKKSLLIITLKVKKSANLLKNYNNACYFLFALKYTKTKGEMP